MEEREKVVKHMWDVYTNSRRIRIPRFWQEAFEAAYEELTTDIAEVREAAISEIANMSMNSINLESPPSVVVSYFTFVYFFNAVYALLVFELIDKLKRSTLLNLRNGW